MYKFYFDVTKSNIFIADKLFKVGSPGVVVRINLTSLTTIQRHIFSKYSPSLSDISRVCKPMNRTPIDTNQVDTIK